MSWIDWVPTAVLAGILWVSRQWISARLTASIKHNYDEKIEKIRSEHHLSEESFRADLRTKEAQISTLLSTAMAGLTNRQAALDKRRLEAVDQLWRAFTALAPLKWNSSMMAAIKFEAALSEAAKNPQARKMFETLSPTVDVTTINTKEADEARPYLSDLAWAFYSAYIAILTFATMQLKLLTSGLDKPNFLDESSVEKLIKVALPHQQNYVAKYGSAAYHHLLDELESKLLEELRKILQGSESSRENVQQAANILEESKRVMKTASKPVET